MITLCSSLRSYGVLPYDHIVFFLMIILCSSLRLCCVLLYDHVFFFTIVLGSSLRSCVLPYDYVVFLQSCCVLQPMLKIQRWGSSRRIHRVYRTGWSSPIVIKTWPWTATWRTYWITHWSVTDLVHLPFLGIPFLIWYELIFPDLVETTFL